VRRTAANANQYKHQHHQHQQHHALRVCACVSQSGWLHCRCRCRADNPNRRFSFAQCVHVFAVCPCFALCPCFCTYIRPTRELRHPICELRVRAAVSKSNCKNILKTFEKWCWAWVMDVSRLVFSKSSQRRRCFGFLRNSFVLDLCGKSEEVASTIFAQAPTELRHSICKLRAALLSVSSRIRKLRVALQSPIPICELQHPICDRPAIFLQSRHPIRNCNNRASSSIRNPSRATISNNRFASSAAISKYSI
jgi:hypothetical protein